MNKSKKKRICRNSVHSFHSLYSERDRALERVMDLWLRNEPNGPDELNKAIDVLTIAHTKATFDWASRSFTELER